MCDVFPSPLPSALAPPVAKMCAAMTRYVLLPFPEMRPLQTVSFNEDQRIRDRMTWDTFLGLEYKFMKEIMLSKYIYVGQRA